VGTSVGVSHDSDIKPTRHAAVIVCHTFMIVTSRM
jgi:hypothetical protein